ncbi:hypothetical protein SCAR479_02924 [Seiridium cardinale]|uniref:Clr5 domain-containing protein n=1 Tax=Seiridium cardinale TaxID=138064 RepID=A0ABR2Y2I3_9PEZI
MLSLAPRYIQFASQTSPMPLKKMTRVLWEEYKDRIWRWYMVEDLKLKDILQNFKNDGINVNKNQLDFQLMKWNMRKNITEEEAKWMANQMDNQVPGNSIVFVRSGKRLRDDRVEVAIQKHARRPTLLPKFPSRNLFSGLLSLSRNTDQELGLIASITSPPPQNPGPNGLIVCRPGSGDMNVHFSQSLPWIKFKSALLDRSIRIEIMSGPQSQSPLQEILPWTLRDHRTGSTDFQICMIASRLGQFMPEAYIGEHVRGVHSMMRSWLSEPAAVLEILIFQLSNGFLDKDFDHYAVIRLLRLAGLDTSKAIRSLMRVANGQPTIAAVLDQIWEAAWRTRSVDITTIFSTEHKTLSCEGANSHLRFEVFTALAHMITSEDLSLAKAIIGSGSASITQQLGQGGSGLLIQCCASKNHNFAIEMASLLLSAGASVSKSMPEALHYALLSDNIPLRNLLIDHDSNWYCGDSHIIIDWEDREIWWTWVPPIPVVERITVETSAIISIDPGERNPFAEYVDDYRTTGAITVPPYSQEAEERSIATYLWLMEKKLFARGNLPEQERDAGDTGKPSDIDLLVLASALGYNKLLRCILGPGDDVNRANSCGLWPLGAAVLGNHPDTYHVLLGMGADPKFNPSHTEYPGLLHLAAWIDAELLIKLLTEHGVDVDEPSIFPEVYESVHFETASLSALAFAIIYRSWKAATLLVRLGAIIGPVELCLAVESGNHSFVKLMLRTGPVYNGAVISSPRTLLDIALDCGHGKICDIISEEYGLSVCSELLPRAAECGSSKLVSQILKANPLSINPQLLMEATTNALKNGMSDITDNFICSTHEGASTILPAAFGSYSVEKLERLLVIADGDIGSEDRRYPQASLCLELALLYNSDEVTYFALSAFPKTYSSGALYAALLRSLRSNDFGQTSPLRDMIQRRQIATDVLDHSHENMVLGLAAYWGVPMDLLEAMVELSNPESRTVSISQQYWSSMEAWWVNIWECLETKLLGFGDDLWSKWPLSVSNKISLSPIAMAIKGGNHDVVALSHNVEGKLLEHIISRCTDIDQQFSDYDATPLQFAVRSRLSEMAFSLLRTSADPNASYYRDGRRETVLQTAIRVLDTEEDWHVVQELIKAGANVNGSASLAGETALQIAARKGRLQIVAQLIDLGADVNAPRAPFCGDTCLEAAASFGRLDMVKFLLDSGARVHGKGKIQYIRSVKLAMSKGYAAVADLLRKHRSWDDECDRLFEDSELLIRPILHPLEYSESQIQVMRRQLNGRGIDDQWIWPRGVDSVITGPDAAYSNDGNTSAESQIYSSEDDPNDNATADVGFSNLDNSNMCVGMKMTDVEDHTGHDHRTLDWDTNSVNFRMPLHPAFLEGESVDFHERIMELD